MALKDALAASEAATARVWRLVDDLEAKAAAAASAASRETCDVEGLQPLCDAVRREPQQTLPARIRQRWGLTSNFLPHSPMIPSMIPPMTQELRV